MSRSLQLEISLTSPELDEAMTSQGLASPKYGEHRQFSASAKWANSKSLALEYLKRQREIILWIESVLDRKLGSSDLFEALRSGIVLREMLVRLYPSPAECLSPISRHYSARMAPWKERENITVFLKQCKSLGMNEGSLFCTDDLYEGSNMVQVLFALQNFIKFAEEESNHLFRPISTDPITFSNQEVEMALSKIEQAGLESTSYQNLVSAASQSHLNLWEEDPSVQFVEDEDEDEADDVDQESDSSSVQSEQEIQNSEEGSAAAAGTNDMTLQAKSSMGELQKSGSAQATEIEQMPEKIPQTAAQLACNQQEHEVEETLTSSHQQTDCASMEVSKRDILAMTELAIIMEGDAISRSPSKTELSSSSASKKPSQAQQSMSITESMTCTFPAVKSDNSKVMTRRTTDEEIQLEANSRCTCGAQQCAIQ